MAHRHIRTIALAALAVSSTAGAAHAGGLEANGYNWDLLFDPATYTGKGTVSQVLISHDIQNPTLAAGAGTVGTSSDRTYYNFAVKADLIDNASCMVSLQNPWGSGTDRDATYARDSGQAAKERLTSNDLGLTCSYGFEVGPGVLSVIGGVSAQQLDYEATLALPAPLPAVTENVSLNGSGTGWRAGLAYEMPEIALRVSAIYNAAIDYEMKGDIYGNVLPLSDATADVTTPQSVEIKAQSGIAPGWLALGSIKWVDWSVLQALTVENAVSNAESNFEYEDGWTVSAGLGHQLTDEVTLLGSLTWDKGTSRDNGTDTLAAGVQTDRWGVALGGAYKPSENFELSGGVSYSLIGSGSNALGETWDTGNVLAFSLSAKASF